MQSGPASGRLFQRDDDAVRGAVDAYTSLHDEARGGDVAARKRDYETLINRYYDLVTDFYEFGWGQSFHFAPRRRGESFAASILRHEMFLACSLGLRPGMRVLDLGCGVGGPMRNIASHSGATVIGINNNDYQIERGRKYNRKLRLEELCSFLKGDFMKIPIESGTIDAAYTIEAACHAPDKRALFAEIRRALKPGALFAGYDWCLTDRYDPQSAEHRGIKKGIEEGDALPDILTIDETAACLSGAGFEILSARDVALDSDPEVPWYLPLTGRELSLRSIPRTPAGRSLTNAACRVLERLKLAPEGTSRVSDFLNVAADALVAGGQTGVFTPMYFFLGRNPG
jgi:sterol 24-C-methyltransferase